MCKNTNYSWNLEILNPFYSHNLLENIVAYSMVWRMITNQKQITTTLLKTNDASKFIIKFFHFINCSMIY